jgi:hypothetical protein
MTSNIILLIGPALGLAVARFFGPVRTLPALGVAILGQLVVFGGYAAWQYARVQHMLANPSEGQVVLWTLPGQPTLSGRLFVVAGLILIAGVVAALFLGAQYLATRLMGHQSAAV